MFACSVRPSAAIESRANDFRGAVLCRWLWSTSPDSSLKIWGSNEDVSKEEATVKMCRLGTLYLQGSRCDCSSCVDAGWVDPPGRVSQLEKST